MAFDVQDIAALSFFIDTRSIGDLVPDIVISEVIDDGCEITSHPIENGAEINDHIIQKPITCTIECGWSESIINNLSVRDIYQKILDLKDSAKPFTVKLGKRILDNMLFTSIKNTTDANSEYYLYLTLELKQVKIVELQEVTLKGGDTAKASTSEQGTKQVQNVSNAGGSGGNSTAQGVQSQASKNSSTLYDLIKGF